LLNHLQVLSPHCEPGAERVPVVVPSIVIDLRFAQRGEKPLPRALDRKDKSISARRCCSLCELLNRLHHGVIHRDHSRRSIFRSIQVDLSANEVDVI
jgi:hypothetical protein